MKTFFQTQIWNLKSKLHLIEGCSKGSTLGNLYPLYGYRFLAREPGERPVGQDYKVKCVNTYLLFCIRMRKNLFVPYHDLMHFHRRWRLLRTIATLIRYCPLYHRMNIRLPSAVYYTCYVIICLRYETTGTSRLNKSQNSVTLSMQQ
jgi:hypothetical protein